MKIVKQFSLQLDKFREMTTLAVNLQCSKQNGGKHEWDKTFYISLSKFFAKFTKFTFLISLYTNTF